MLKASISFFVLGIICVLLGVNSIAGLSIDFAKILLFVFLLLSVLSFFLGRRGKATNLIAITFFITIGTFYPAYGDDSISKTAKEIKNDSKRLARHTLREAKDKTCKLVNGKMECAVKKIKHVVQEGADRVEDAID